MSNELWLLISLIIMMFLCFGGAYIMYRVIRMRWQIYRLELAVWEMQKASKDTGGEVL